MSLRLNLLKSPSGVTASRTHHDFDQAGGTLGRSATNSWPLPDPDKFLSSCHCEIALVGNQYFVLDRSTNGTFLNGASEPVGRGNRAAVSHGDVIDLGDYRFEVNIEMSAQAQSADPFASPRPVTQDPFSNDLAAFSQGGFTSSAASSDPFAAADIFSSRADFGNSDPFGATNSFAATDPFAVADPFAVTDPFAVAATPSRDLSNASADYFGAITQSSNPNNFDDFFAQSDTGNALASQDPLAAWGVAAPTRDHATTGAHTPAPTHANSNFGFASASASAAPQNLAAHASIDDFLGLDSANHQQDYASFDTSAAPDQAISWPQTHAESLIPEDWTDDFLQSPSPAASVLNRAATVATAATTPAIDVANAINRAGEFAAAGAHLEPSNSLAAVKIPSPTRAPSPAAASAAPRQPLADRLAALNAITSAPARADLAQIEPFYNPATDAAAARHAYTQDTTSASETAFKDAAYSADAFIADAFIGQERPEAALTDPAYAGWNQPARAPERTAAAPRSAETPHQHLPPATSGAQQSRFIEALGLDRSRLTDAEVGDVEEMAGKLLREVVDGMLGVLRSRANIKNEFRMNVTTIQPIENNPLKFSVNVDDALENLFIKKTNAYKRPPQAFKEGFQEIAEHQLAMIAGIRAGFDQMMERFNPAPLEVSFTKQTKSSVIPGMQKAKYWSSYHEYYAQLSDNMDHAFQQLFGSEFVTAYEDQLRRLAAARHKENMHGKVQS